MVNLGAGSGLAALLCREHAQMETIFYLRASHWMQNLRKHSGILLMLYFLFQELSVLSHLHCYPYSVALVFRPFYDWEALSKVKPSQTNSIDILTDIVTSRAFLTTEILPMRSDHLYK
jgi:hypothetical protein